MSSFMENQSRLDTPGTIINSHSYADYLGDNGGYLTTTPPHRRHTADADGYLQVGDEAEEMTQTTFTGTHRQSAPEPLYELAAGHLYDSAVDHAHIDETEMEEFEREVLEGGMRSDGPIYSTVKRTSEPLYDERTMPRQEEGGVTYLDPNKLF